MMALPPFKLEHYFAKYEFKARYMLCGSDCETLSVRELLELEESAGSAFLDHRLGYTETLGHPLLRKEITGLFQGMLPDQILVHTGAEEAIFTFMHAALQRGDHIIVHYPCYQSLYDIPRSIGCDVTLWTTRQEDHWELDLDFLEDHLRPNTKVVVINGPHNPTGYLMSKEKLADLDKLSKERGFIIFSDEVYRFLEYREEDRLPALCDINDQAVSLGVMSKAFGLAGLRIGWIATKNETIYQRQNAFKHYTTICNSALSEFIATLALRHRDTILDRNRRLIAQNLEHVNRFFARHQDRFHWQAPRAGPIAFPSLIEEDVEQFCLELLTQAEVLLLPGTIYDEASSNFRIGFGRKNLPEGLERFERYLMHM